MRSKTHDVAILILRAVLGITFILHGGQKLFGAFGGHGMEAFAEGLAKMGLSAPVFWAWVAAIAEFFGGLGVLGGLLTRLSALGIASTMVFAIWRVHGKGGFFAQNKGYEYNLMILAVCAALILMGPGRYSIQGWFEARRRLAAEK